MSCRSDRNSTVGNKSLGRKPAAGDDGDDDALCSNDTVVEKQVLRE